MSGRTLEILEAANFAQQVRMTVARWGILILSFWGAMGFVFPTADAQEATVETRILKDFAYDVQSGSRCIAHGSPYGTLVFGLDQETKQFTEAEINEIKAHVEAQLVSVGSGVFNVVNRKLDSREISERVTTGEDRSAVAAKLLHSSEQELLVFINVHRTEDDRTSYSLVAYSAQGECAHTPEDELKFSLSKSLRSESFQVLLNDFRREVVAATADAASNTQDDIEVDMCPVVPEDGGVNACGGRLQDELISALTQNDDSGLGGHRVVSPALIDAAKCQNDPNPTIAMRFAHAERRGRLNVTLKLMKSAHIRRTMIAEVFDLPAGCATDEPHPPGGSIATVDPLAPNPKPTYSPAPAIMVVPTLRQRALVERTRALVEKYWAITNDSQQDGSALEPLYADTVTFFGDHKTKDEIVRLKVAYFKDWSSREYSDPNVNVNCDGSLCTERGEVDWRVVSETRRVVSSGRSTFAFAVDWSTGDGKIVSETSAVLNREAHKY